MFLQFMKRKQPLIPFWTQLNFWPLQHLVAVSHIDYFSYEKVFLIVCFKLAAWRCEHKLFSSCTLRDTEMIVPLSPSSCNSVFYLLYLIFSQLSHFQGRELSLPSLSPCRSDFTPLIIYLLSPLFQKAFSSFLMS